MSGAQTSPWLTTNELLAPMAAYDTHANQLLAAQQRQQDIAANNTEVVARAASTLLDPTLYPTDEARAAAWPGVIKQLKASGFAPNAPEAYPGEQHLRLTARLGTPSKDLYAQGLAGQAASDFGTRWGTQPSATGGGTGATAPASTAPAASGAVEPDALARAQAVRDGFIKRGLDVDTATGLAANALHESGANPNVGAGDRGASHGAFQWTGPRYDRYIKLNGHPPDNAPLDEQLDFVINEFNTTEGAARDRIAAAQGPAGKAAAISQYYLRPKDVQAEMGRRSGTATQLATQWGGAGTSTAAPVITGDSLASQGGLGGSGVVGDSPAKVLARVQAESRAGKYSGLPVVLSTGASNNPADLDSVEQQIREAQGGNAGRITVLGVGPAVEAKAPGTNAKLQALAKSYGADFIPLPADQMSPDGVHPTAQGYATLKAAIAPAQGGTGAPTADGRYQVASNAPTAPPASTASPAPLPPQQAVAQARSTGQPVPVAGTQGLWALPNGNMTSTPPAATAPPVAQQPPAPTAAQPAQPTIPPPPRIVANDMTAEQLAEIPVLKRQVQLGQITAAEADARLLKYQDQNRAAQRQYALDVQGQQKEAAAAQNQQQQLRLSQESAARAEEDAARKRAQDADPIKGTDDKANADRLLLKYVDGILDGSATPAQRRLYAEAAQYYLKPQMQWIDDPGDPTKKQMVATPGQLPEGFPHPSFKPGEQQTQAPAVATKTDFKPLPETERKQLIDTATRIDQETQQRNTFKPEFAGFGNAAIGEFANAVARNNPIASKADTARAEWWQNYQRYKLAVRQGISGQSLTASELGEFDKADIHPGMTAQAVRDNLLQQDKILRTAHERRVGSLAADRYSPDAIMAASGVDPTKVTARPLTEGNAPKPDTAPHPRGWEVVIP